jgi:hypothetical protein
LSHSWDGRFAPPRSACLLRWGLANFLPRMALNLSSSALKELRWQMWATTPSPRSPLPLTLSRGRAWSCSLAGWMCQWLWSWRCGERLDKAVACGSPGGGLAFCSPSAWAVRSTVS